ncbi:hypothetical protein JMA_38780 (plasmid) [Jeotgalibacillus malaysiensis]|uniref:Uncharacterized protein n=1 Tax=Jeotgalibacillus malaysiensis TaxID=1508404 RepID=A0A0B5ASV1_9BACL|nr:hypothetical protein [Jeotgalibacillus malaysiensis]AJD93196.1 hypothetical protein JMA_38780 [Jeotgalibacillus malaysiensis]
MSYLFWFTFFMVVAIVLWLEKRETSRLYQVLFVVISTQFMIFVSVKSERNESFLLFELFPLSLSFVLITIILLFNQTKKDTSNEVS